MRLHNKIRIILLSILILIVNGLTVFYLIPQSDRTENSSGHNTSLFGNPSEILIRNGDQEKLLLPTDDAYKKILSMNEQRASFATYFFEDRIALSKEKGSLYMEYRYATPHSITIPQRLENKTFKTQQICFSLTGSDSTRFSIITNGKERSFETLNIDADLIELSKKLLQ